MKHELQIELRKRYPYFYRECVRTRHQVNVMTGADVLDQEDLEPFDEQGIECGDGWFDLIDRLSFACEAEIQVLVAQGFSQDVWPRAAQIKEMFGGLRFYVRGAVSEGLRALIQQAESETSFQICERCGADGRLRPGRWSHTCCDPCSLTG